MDDLAYQQERERKQQYLIDHILSQGYDPNQFAQYMSDKKENGNDVDSWTLNQITYMVEEFKILYNPIDDDQDDQKQYQQQQIKSQEKPMQNQQLVQQQKLQVVQQQQNQKVLPLNDQQQSSLVLKDQPKSEVAPQAQKVSLPPPKNIQGKKYESIESEKQFSSSSGVNLPKHESFDFELSREDSKVIEDINIAKNLSKDDLKSNGQLQVIATQNLIPTKLNNLKTSFIDVKVFDGTLQVVKKFLNSTQFVAFKIKVPQLGWEVRRQDQDFNTLQTYLTRAFPHIIIPPITQFKVKKQPDQMFFKKRGRILEKFLKGVLRSEELKSDQMLVSFLSLQDNKIYDIQLKAASKVQEPYRLADITTCRGQVIVDAQAVQSIMSDSNKLPKFVKQYESSHRRLYQQFKRLSEDLKIVGTTIQNIQDEFTILEEIHQSFINSNDKQKSQNGLCALYKNLNESMQLWSQSYFKQKETVDENIQQFFHFYALQGEQITYFYNRITNILDQYIQSSMQISQRKEKLWEKRDIMSMDLPQSKLAPEQIEAFFADKEKAFSQMLPKETAYANDLGQMFAYLIQQFKVEIEKIEEASLVDIKENMKTISEAVIESYSNQISIWTDIEERLNLR